VQKGSTMPRILVLLVAMALLGVVFAQEHGPPPAHPHMLVQAPQLGVIYIEDVPFEAVVGWRKCVDLAGGRTVPLQAHHDGVHTGRAGAALFENANIWAIPGAPITPWANCAALRSALPIPLGPAE
jgi:hypothetical protein